MQYDIKLKVVTLILLGLLALSSCAPVETTSRQPSIPVTNLQLVGTPMDVNRDIEIPNHLSERGHLLQTLFTTASISQDIYGRYDTILVQWPDDLDIEGPLTIRIQTSSGRIYLERNFTVGASAVARLGKAYVLPQGDYYVVLMPSPGEYYVEGLRIDRKLAIRIQSSTP